tara:strand:- start:593 stop:1039 length:447 start_codon:yes stop_codon:yes gene_type:complete
MTILVIFLAVFLTVILASLLYYSHAVFILKLLALPSLTVLLIAFIYLLIIKAGAPIQSYPNDNFKYIHHEIMDEGKHIYIWANELDRGNRLYQIDYNRETAKELLEAKNKQQSGASMEGTFGDDGDGNGYPDLFISEQDGMKNENIIK